MNEILEKYEHLIFENKGIEEINEAYFKCLEEGKKQGFIPIVVVGSEILDEALEVNNEAGNTEDILSESEKLDAKDWMSKTLKECEAEEDINKLEKKAKDNKEEFNSETVDENEYLTTVVDYNNLPYEKVYILKIKTDKPWELLAHIPMGGWNDCPLPEVHCSISKYWYEKYGAIPSVITYDTIEYYVENPSLDYDEIIELSIEQFAYCQDIVHQGVGDLFELSKALKGNKVWYFWWD